MINAAYNYRNFWDGRANNVFNGVNPFGDRDPDAAVLQTQPNGTATFVAIHLENASLASQAVGPALSDFEMSCGKKTFQDLGRKMVPLRALAVQKVHPQDSVLGVLRDTSGNGLSKTYQAMIQAAFLPAWWNATGTYDGYTQIESNFSMFWGLAIMMFSYCPKSKPAARAISMKLRPVVSILLEVRTKIGSSGISKLSCSAKRNLLLMV